MAMPRKQDSEYLRLLEEYYSEGGRVEVLESRYWLVTREWIDGVWLVDVISRRSGEIRTHQEDTYRPIARLLPAGSAWPPSSDESASRQ